MMQTDVLVIGSSAAGLVAATTGKRIYPDKKFLVITKEQKTLVPCGIPYVFGSVDTTSNDIIPVEKMFDNLGIDIIHEEVVSIDKENKTVKLANNSEVSYEKLVLGTGSLPYKPKWLKGYDLERVYYVLKDKVYLDEMQKKLADAKKIIVIGAGFIGVELSDELNKIGKEVTLIEKQENVLSLAFDKEISEKVEELIINRGVKLMTSTGVTEITGTNEATGVLLENGKTIEADAVILAMGYVPNTKLAEAIGLPLRTAGFIKVDEYMRTPEPNIFAVGDCAEKRDFITRQPSPIMLASTACAEARTAGMNLFSLSAIKTFSGTISIFSTAIGNTGFGVAGLTEKVAREEGFDMVTGVFQGIDKHPGTLDDTHTQYVKLIVGKEAGIILGGVVYGGPSVGELINTIGIIIQTRMSLNSLLTAQIGTHPLLTASPAGYPLIKAAENASSKIMFNHE